MLAVQSEAPTMSLSTPIPAAFGPVRHGRLAPDDDTAARGGCPVWRSGELVGVRIEPPLRPEHLALLAQTIRDVVASGAGPIRALFIDARCAGIDTVGSALAPIGRALHGLVASLSPTLAQVALLAPRDWTTPWWHGLALLAECPPPWRTFTDPVEVCHWLRPAAPDPALLDPAPDHLADPLVVALDAAVRAMPGADLRSISRRLGLSQRSLQRALERRGLAFHTLRTRVRLELAEALLACPDPKISALASEIGFASTGHFIRWFRSHRGLTPGAWRAHHAWHGGVSRA